MRAPIDKEPSASLAPVPDGPPPIRLLLAEDCNVTRKMIRRLLSGDDQVEIVAEAVDGAAVIEIAFAALRSGQPLDVVLLDVEMPVMDGLAVLPLLAMLEPAPKVIMVSAFTHRGASISIEALLRGAADFIAKPAGGSPTLTEFTADLLRKIKALRPTPGGFALNVKQRRNPTEPTDHGRPDLASLHPAIAPPPCRASISVAGTGRDAERSVKISRPIGLPSPGQQQNAKSILPAIVRQQASRPGSGGREKPRLTPQIGKRPFLERPDRTARHVNRRGIDALVSQERSAIRLLAIGSSTGGPQALLRLLQGLRAPLGVPIVITQHMQAGFTAILAEQLARQTGLPVQEAKAGQQVTAESILVAPGNRHLLLISKGDELRVELADGPPEHFCRPAVDPMLRSLAATGRRTLAVILTGMGADGAAGCAAIAEAGGMVIVQDRATSVVWGMPGAVVARDVPCEVLPIQAIGPAVFAHCQPQLRDRHVFAG